MRRFAPALLVAVLALGLALAGWLGRAPQGRISASPAISGAATVKSLAELFPRSEDHDFEAPEPGSYTLPRIKLAGDGEVVGIDGRARRLSGFTRGKITILSFIYTMCSDSKGCPLAMSTLFEAHDASRYLPEIAANARFISLSFDPDRDSPETLKSYAYPVLSDPEAGRKMPWDFLTTRSAAELKPILKAYGQVINPAPDGETISHLLRLYLIDRHGYIRNIYGLGFLDPRLMFTDIKTLLLEEAAMVSGRS